MEHLPENDQLDHMYYSSDHESSCLSFVFMPIKQQSPGPSQVGAEPFPHIYPFTRVGDKVIGTIFFVQD